MYRDLGPMTPKTELKLRAIALRKKGNSLGEIVQKLKIAKSSASLWVRNVSLTPMARKRLLTKIKKGQLLGGESKHRKVEEDIAKKTGSAIDALSRKKFDNTTRRLICSLLYYCEGIKAYETGVRFTNSDPKVIRLFLKFFREGFDVNEQKLRVGIHLHEYHNKVTILKFWSAMSNIPLKQFIKPYRKAHTGKRIRDGYSGCATVYYYSNDMARELLSIARGFFEVMGA